MAISAPTKLSDFSGFLSREQAQPIFERAARSSVVQSRAREGARGPAGTASPVATGKLTASWVAEGDQKPASTGSMTLKTLGPKKLAVIAVVSAEVVRANPGGYMQVIRNQVGEAVASALDAAARHGPN